VTAGAAADGVAETKSAQAPKFTTDLPTDLVCIKLAEFLDRRDVAALALTNKQSYTRLKKQAQEWNEALAAAYNELHHRFAFYEVDPGYFKGRGVRCYKGRVVETSALHDVVSIALIGHLADEVLREIDRQFPVEVIREIIYRLIKNGVDPEQMYGEYPELIQVMYARNDSLSLVRLLLEAGCDPNRQDRTPDRAYPLHRAVALGSVEMVKLLLNAGADVNALSNLGTPLNVLHKFQVDARYLRSAHYDALGCVDFSE
jgi:hypothetical protein